MATRTVQFKFQINATFTLEEGVVMEDVVSEMQYAIWPQQEHGDFVDSELIDWEVINSK